MIVVALRRQYKIQAKSSEMVVNCRLRVADVLSESLSSERLKDNRSVEGLTLEYSTFSLVILIARFATYTVSRNSILPCACTNAVTL